APGDVLLIYSDGLTETMNPARELFGEKRLAALLKKYGTQSAQTLIDRIVEEAKLYAGTASPHDDLTLLVMKRLSNGEL
ncbi:MAG: PP2C family protein-serine/threonine phosphatase, partial [Rhodothermales bacterium]